MNEAKTTIAILGPAEIQKNDLLHLLQQKSYELVAFESEAEALERLTKEQAIHYLIYETEAVASSESKKFIECVRAQCPGTRVLVGMPGDLALGSLKDLPTLEELEKRYMKLVLDRTGGRKERAAKILGINRRTLYRKEREFGWVGDESTEGSSAQAMVKER